MNIIIYYSREVRISKYLGEQCVQFVNDSTTLVPNGSNDKILSSDGEKYESNKLAEGQKKMLF